METRFELTFFKNWLTLHYFFSLRFRNRSAAFGQRIIIIRQRQPERATWLAVICSNKRRRLRRRLIIHEHRAILRRRRWAVRRRIRLPVLNEFRRVVEHRTNRISANIVYWKRSEKAILPKSNWPSICRRAKKWRLKLSTKHNSIRAVCKR